MCELCRDPRLFKVRRRRVSHDKDDDDSPFDCEFPVDKYRHKCGEAARWETWSNFVAEHLCTVHRKEVEEVEDGWGDPDEYPDEGERRLGEMLKFTDTDGLGASVRIRERPPCEAWTHRDASGNFDPEGRCGKPARWAHVAALESHLCPAHLKAHESDMKHDWLKRAAETSSRTHEQ